MLKIIVFDGGVGGKLVADFLATELKMVDVTSVIDWTDAPYESRTREEVCRLVSAKIAPYVGKADLIVLGGYLTSVALRRVQGRFPEQRFIGMDLDYNYIIGSHRAPERVTFMANDLIIKGPLWDEIKARLPWLTLIAPDCSGWDEAIDLDEMSVDVLRTELKDYFLLANTMAHGYARMRLADCQGRSVALPPSEPNLVRAGSVNSCPGAPLSLREQIVRFIGRGVAAPRPELAFAAAGLDDFASPVSSSSSGVNMSPSRCAEDAVEIPVRRLPSARLLRTDAVVLLDTNFWAIKRDLQKLFGLGVRVIDFRQQLLHKVCAALELRGLDGRIDGRYEM